MIKSGSSFLILEDLHLPVCVVMAAGMLEEVAGRSRSARSSMTTAFSSASFGGGRPKDLIWADERTGRYRFGDVSLEPRLQHAQSRPPVLRGGHGVGIARAAGPHQARPPPRPAHVFLWKSMTITRGCSRPAMAMATAPSVHVMTRLPAWPLSRSHMRSLP